jgi:SAM-dependent methyltransferase
MSALDLYRIPYLRCPLCDVGEGVELMVADCGRQPNYRAPLPTAMRWLQCPTCAHVYVDGYFSPAGLEVLFSGALASQTPGHDLETARYVSARMIEGVSAFLPSQSGRWLDVGFGNGALLTTAAEFGFDVVGLDLREDTVKLMRELGVEAHALELDDYHPAAPLDVISMADVLEHMPFPKRALAHAHGLLRDGGVLFLSMPNADSFLWQVLTRNGVNPYWHEIEHLHNFGRRRLYALLREHGFEPVRYAVSLRYRACMEVIAKKVTPAG